MDTLFEMMRLFEQRLDNALYEMALSNYYNEPEKRVITSIISYLPPDGDVSDYEEWRVDHSGNEDPKELFINWWQSRKKYNGRNPHIVDIRSFDKIRDSHFSFEYNDKITLANQKTIKKLESRLNNSNYNWNIIIGDYEGLNIYDRLMWPDVVKSKLGIETENHITFIKQSSSGHTLTPDMLIHTIGHAVIDHIRNYHTQSHSLFKNVVNAILYKVEGLTQVTNSPFVDTNALDDISRVALVMPFGSARYTLLSIIEPQSNRVGFYRDRRIIDWAEVQHEIVAQYVRTNYVKVGPNKIAQQIGFNGDFTTEEKQLNEVLKQILDACVGYVIYD